jgi:hypothetical protein
MGFGESACAKEARSSPMDVSAPSPPPVPPPDPLVVQSEQTAQNQTIEALQTQARSDMGSLMSAYGSLALNMGASSGAPSSFVPFGASDPFADPFAANANVNANQALLKG